MSFSQIGSSLTTHLPNAYYHQHCHLCDLSFDVVNKDIPCLHWCISPYCKPERLQTVIETFGTVDVVKYLYLCMVIEKRSRLRASPFVCKGEEGQEITIRYKSHVWVFRIAGNGVGEVELRHRVSGPRFNLPLRLEPDEMRMLAELAHLRAPDGLADVGSPGAATAGSVGAAHPA